MQLDEILRCINTSGGPDTCWEWTRARLPKPNRPYGMVLYEGKMWRVHRLMWTLANGPILDRLLVCHTCDNPPCCNWEQHLFLGDYKANATDMVTKGRNRGMWDNPTVETLFRYHSAMAEREQPRGAKHPQAVLTAEQAEAIRSAPARWGVITDLAQEYNVSHTTISKIRRGMRYS